MWATRLGATMIVLMVAGIAWASVAGGGMDTLSAMMREPLYLVTLLDLYLACAVIAAWVWIRERSVATLAGWSLLFVLSGSIGAGLYVMIAAMRSRGDLQRFMMGVSAAD